MPFPLSAIPYMPLVEKGIKIAFAKLLFVSAPVSLLVSLILPLFYDRLWLAFFFQVLLLDRASGVCSRDNIISKQTFPV